MEEIDKDAEETVAEKTVVEERNQQANLEHIEDKGETEWLETTLTVRSNEDT